MSWKRTRGPGSPIELLHIALPLVASQACETIMMFTDRLFLARLGPQYMSAALSGGLCAFALMTFFLGLTGYANALVAQYYGAGQPRRCGPVVVQALIISVVAYPVTLCFIPVGRALFEAMGIAPEQLGPQGEYYSILTAGAIVPLLRNTLSAHFSGIGRTRIILVSAAVSMAVNVGANYVLIFGKFGAPALGIRGAAFGTILGGTVGLGVVAAAFLGRANRDRFGLRHAWRYDAGLMRKLIRYGSPSGAEFFLNMLAFNLLVLIFHSYGLEVAAAVTLAYNWDLVSFIPLIGVNIGVTSLVGRYMGAGSPDTAHRAAMSGLAVACAYTTCIVALFVSSPDALVDLFRPAGPDAAFAAARPLAVFMVRVVSVYVFADAFALVLSGALRGAGDTWAAMVLSVSSHWLLAGVAFVMVRVVGARPAVSWTVIAVLVWAIGIAFLLRYRSGRWRSIRVVAPEPGSYPPEAVPP